MSERRESLLISQAGKARKKARFFDGRVGADRPRRLCYHAALRTNRNGTRGGKSNDPRSLVDGGLRRNFGHRRKDGPRSKQARNNSAAEVLRAARFVPGVLHDMLPGDGEGIGTCERVRHCKAATKA